jgi:putative transmembrane protein PGPGW
MEAMTRMTDRMPSRARRIAVAAAGSTLVAAGLALLVLPGPGLLLLTAGLALLATEFAWAQRWLTRLRGHTKRAVRRVGSAKPSA